MTIAQPKALARAPLPAIPRQYNFAADILKHNLDAGRAGKLAFIDQTQGWTYGALADRVERFGHGLRALGLRREERVLLCLFDTIDWPTAFLGAIKAGIVPVPVNTLLTEDDYRFMLEDSRARLLVVSEELYPKFAKALAASAEPPPVVVSGTGTHHHTSFEALLAGAAGEPVTAPTVCDDICFWLYTSGSTGKPKAAVHTHAALKLTDDLYGKPYLGIGERDVCFSVAKLFFAYGLGNALTFPMSAGATTVLLAQRPTPEAVADLLQKHGVTVFYAVAGERGGAIRQPQAPLLRVGRRSATRGCGPSFPRAPRRGHFGRHRLDRNAAHFHFQQHRRGEIRHHRQTGARLRRAAS